MKIKCKVCPRKCLLSEGQLGFCKGRKAENRKTKSINYGKITAMALDPIEKKPLYRFMPGSNILSVGSFGCNLTCDFCQNYRISTSDGNDIEKLNITPEQLTKKALELVPKGNIGVAYTYNEPLIGYEYVVDCSKKIHENNLKNIIVTNGYIENNILKKVLQNTDAVNIDLKSFNNDFYKNIGGNLDIVKENIKTVEKYCHLEIATLIIPKLNDSNKEIENLAKWISSVNSKIPLHISRFFPAYKMYNEDPTPVEKVYELVEIAKKYLEYVYPGNC